MNLIDSISEKLNIGKLRKIDPDTGLPLEDEKGDVADKFSQLAIPAVLTGFYRFTRIDANNVALLKGDEEQTLAALFDEAHQPVITKISEVSGKPVEEVRTRMSDIAGATSQVVRENLPKDATDQNVKNFFTTHRHEILQYLDPQLQLGSLIKDDTMDDATNKMEGPVTDMVHKIGEFFTGSGNDDKPEV